MGGHFHWAVRRTFLLDSDSKVELLRQRLGDLCEAHPSSILAAGWRRGPVRMSEPAIEFKAVNKWFGGLHVLRDITLGVSTGEVVVVCGPSGSGKSTLIRCVNALERIQSGDLMVLGESVSRPDAEPDGAPLPGRDGVSVVQPVPAHDRPRERRPRPHEGPRPRREEAEQLARALLERVRIPEKAEHYPASLSGGQQQRVAIAQLSRCSPRSCCSTSLPRRSIPR